MRGKVWAFNPHSGEKKITPDTQAKVRKRITEHAEKNYAGKFTHLDIKFRGALCYIDAYKEPYAPEGDPPEWMDETREQYIERLRNTPTQSMQNPTFRHQPLERGLLHVQQRKIRTMHFPQWRMVWYSGRGFRYWRRLPGGLRDCAVKKHHRQRS